MDALVTAILAIQSKTLNIKKAPDSVIVDDPRWLLRRLRKQRRELSDEQYQQLVSVVSNPDTWAVVHEDPTSVMSEFSRLQKQVKSAQRTKLVWLSGLTIGGIWLLPPIVTALVTGFY